MNIIKYVNHKLLCPQRDPQPSLMSLDLLGPTGRSYPGFYEVTAFAAVSAHMRLCVHPSTEESLFSPVLWNSWYQVPLAFKAKWCGVSSWCQTAIRSLMLSSETSLLWGNLCNIIIFQFVGCPPGMSGIRLCVECAPLLSCCGFFFALDVKCLFLVYAILFCQWLFSSSLWLGVFSWEEVSSGPSTLPSYQMILGSILNELWKVEFI